MTTTELILWTMVAILYAWGCLLVYLMHTLADLVNQILSQERKEFEGLQSRVERHRIQMVEAWESRRTVIQDNDRLRQVITRQRMDLAGLRIHRLRHERQTSKLP